MTSPTGSAATAWWAIPEPELLQDLGAEWAGLSSGEASARLKSVGPNRVRPREEATRWSVLVKQIRSPLVLILVVAAVVAGIVAEWLDAIIIISIVFGERRTGVLPGISGLDRGGGVASEGRGAHPRAS